MIDSKWLCEATVLDKYIADAIVAVRHGDISRWRQSDSIVTVTDNCYPIYGTTYWEIAKDLGGDQLLKAMPRIVEIETILPPRVLIQCDQWTMSPSLCRHLVRALELDCLFNLEDQHIMEIGGGWGGLCAVIHAMFEPASYCICDLQWITKAQQKALRAVGVDSVRFVKNPHDDAAMKSACGTILISDYAFSELTESGQNDYARWFKEFPCGAMLCPPHLGAYLLRAPEGMKRKLEEWIPTERVEWGPEIEHYRRLAYEFGDPRMPDAYLWGCHT